MDQKSNETTAFGPPLSGLNLAGITVTMNAMHTVRANLDWLVTVKNAHYLAVIKTNQPMLRARLARLPWVCVPTTGTTRDHGHGRDETRILNVTAVSHLDFPHARQAVRIRQWWRRQTSRRPSRETVHVITDLTCEQAGPAQLADLARGHWHVENKVRHVRGVIFGEERSTVRAGNGRTNLATLRSAVSNALRRAGYRYILHGRRGRTTPTAALDLHGFP